MKITAKPKLEPLKERSGWAVQITRKDGSTFLASSGRGVVTPVWNTANRNYADGFARELVEMGFSAKRVRVRYAIPELK